MTRSDLHDQYRDLLMNIQAWGADIGVGAHTTPNLNVTDQEVYAIVVTRLDRLSRDRKQMIEGSGLEIDAINMDNGEIILVPPSDQ